jgi:N-acetylneuraminic acid mutarotase
VVNGTAYVVGGFTGQNALSTVVAWQPGIGAHIVASLPTAVRYPVVANVGDQVIIAGGTTSAGASKAIYDFNPSNSQVDGVVALPDPLTHAASAVLDGRLYLLGGRLSAQGTQTDRILVYDPATGQVSQAGTLPGPLSDADALALSNQILVAGGVDETGRVHDEVYLGALQ